MCKCNPNIQVPFCGKGNCFPPDILENKKRILELAEKQGALAFVHNIKPGDNPYSPEDDKHWAWYKGWCKIQM